MLRRLLLPLAAASALAAPAAAQAAPAKISPNAVTVSAAGAATVEIANPNAYRLTGKVRVEARGTRLVTKTVSLPRRAVSEVRLRFGAAALRRLRAAKGRATVTLRSKRAGTARRTVTLRVEKAAAPAPAPAPAPQPAAPAPPQTPVRWNARMGTEGGYDDFELGLENGQLTFAKPPTVPVMCFENGGSYRSALSFEIFDAPGPWTVGQDGELRKEGAAVNQLVGSSARGITYKVTGTSADAGKVAGTLHMSFFESKYDVFSNTITFINCSGSQSFEAVPAT